MDFSQLDKVRRTTTPLQLDIVESFARGRISRREFIKRGLVIGLSMASISAVIAACGGATTPSPAQSTAAGASSGASTGASAAAGASGSGTTAVKTGGTIRVACQTPRARSIRSR